MISDIYIYIYIYTGCISHLSLSGCKLRPSTKRFFAASHLLDILRIPEIHKGELHAHRREELAAGPAATGGACHWGSSSHG